MSVSIREIAQKAGVSAGTVSHVLNGRETARISAATQAKVRAAAQEMGYRPNRLAQSLWRKRTDTIGLMVSGLKNPFFVELMEAAETAVLKAGYQVLVDSGPSVRGTYSRHNVVHNWPVDGALAWTNPDQTITSFTGPSGGDIPTVYLGFERSDRSDWVGFDLTQGATDAASHLMERTRRRLAYVSAYDLEKAVTEKRFLAYQDACAKAGMEPLLLTTENEEETRGAAAKLGMQLAQIPEEERPDSFLCHNDVLAIGLICGLKRGGLSIPRDAAVAGFDGIEEGLYLPEPLTSVRTDPEELVAPAVRFLIQRLHQSEKEGAGEPLTALVAGQLRVGGTS